MIWLYAPAYVYQSTSGWSLCCGTSTGINRCLLEHTVLRTPFLLNPLPVTNNLALVPSVWCE
jgi:hypothetical protein